MKNQTRVDGSRVLAMLVLALLSGGWGLKGQDAGSRAIFNKPGISVSPAALDFGSQMVGIAGSTQSVTVTSTGSSTLTIKSVSTSSWQFRVQSGPPFP